MPGAARVNADLHEAEAFAESVAGVLRRHEPAGGSPGVRGAVPDPGLAQALDDIGWDMVCSDPELVTCAGLGAVELGRAVASIWHVDRLLGASPVAGDLVREAVLAGAVVTWRPGGLTRRAVLRSAPCPAAGGLEVHRVLELGDEEQLGERHSRVATAAWLAAGVGYLAGLGEAALDVTAEYVRRRPAFGTTLAGLSAVQQLLASAATAVRGVRLLAAAAPGAEGLAHAGPAVAEACSACHQVTGAVGFTLEHPLHRFSQRARAVAVFNDALLGSLDQQPPPHADALI